MDLYLLNKIHFGQHRYKQFSDFRRVEENRRGADASVNRESCLAAKRTVLRSNMRRKRRLFSR